MTLNTDYWLCDDCVPIAVNGDATHLDYHYGQAEADARHRQIETGLSELALGGWLVPDHDFETLDGVNDHSLDSCDCCGDHRHGQRLRFAIISKKDGAA